MAASMETARCPRLKRKRRPRKSVDLSGPVQRLSPAADEVTSPVVDDVSRGFVQRLAANEPRTRRRALVSLRRFLRVKSAAEALPSSQQLFLWKGLFYALWQQDKPLLQEELIVSICSLLHELQTETTQLEFTEAYWLTVKREWNGIDHFRLDKFYLLVRTFLAQTFVLLRRTGWDKNLITRFLSPLSLIVLGVEGGQGDPVFKQKKERGPSAIEEAAKCKGGRKAVMEYSNGLRFHVAEIFIKELNRAARNLPEDAVLLFLEPFVHVLATTEEDLWMDVVCRTVFEDLLKGRASKSKQRGNAKISKNVPESVEENGDGDEGEEEQEIEEEGENEEIEDDSSDQDVYDYEGHQLQVSYSEISQLVLNSAAQPVVRQKNRRRMYQVVQRFRSATVEMPLQESQSSTGEVLCRSKEKDQMVRKRKRKMEEMAELKVKNKKNRKQKKQKKKTTEQLNKDVGVVETEGQRKKVRTGKAEIDELKKKLMDGGEEVAEGEDAVVPEEDEEVLALEEEEEDEAVAAVEAEEEEEAVEEAEEEDVEEAEEEDVEEAEEEDVEEAEEEDVEEAEEEDVEEAEEEDVEEAEEEDVEEAEEEDVEEVAVAVVKAEEVKAEGVLPLKVGRAKRANKRQEGRISANLKECKSEKRVKFRLKKNQTNEYSPLIPLNLKKRTLIPFDPNTPTLRSALKVGRH
uniref:ribosomal RNA processing protein 1 homolog A-like n=1 Tax=Myxine glutinosa TaxID=7769 RepID=UPI00358E5E5E